MAMTDDTDRLRELGIEFGSLVDQLADHEYPTTSSTLVDAYGDTVLELQNGEQTLREVFEPVPDQEFETRDEVRSAIFIWVGEQAIGRKGYSDRTPPALGEDRGETTESF